MLRVSGRVKLPSAVEEVAVMVAAVVEKLRADEEDAKAIQRRGTMEAMVESINNDLIVGLWQQQEQKVMKKPTASKLRWMLDRSRAKILQKNFREGSKKVPEFSEKWHHRRATYKRHEEMRSPFCNGIVASPGINIGRLAQEKMGNKQSNGAGEKEAQTEKKSCATTSSSTLATQLPSDDKLQELVEATADTQQQEQESPAPKQNMSIFSKIGTALFPPPRAAAETSSPQSLPPTALPPIKVRLCHCATDDEHRTYISNFLNRVGNLHGEQGLREAGFEYRKLYCSEHEPVITSSSKDNNSDDDTTTQEEKKCDAQDESQRDKEDSTVNNVAEEMTTRTGVMDAMVSDNTNSNKTYKPCLHCATRLYYCETDILITEENRKLYIADGEMYEEVTRLAQEYAQELMQREGNLEWVTVCNDPAHSQPVRALVHEDHHLVSESNEREDTADDHPTLLIATGKGKVRAGIFSRRFLLTAGLESSTALPMVIEAAQRQMSVVIFDPNARGDRKGMDTFEKSFNAVLGHLDHVGEKDSETAIIEDVPSKRALYIVAHSASGSQLVRYMLDRVHGYLPYLRAIAFTDSTHNIQWTRKNAALQSLLGSKKCVYFRSASKNHDDLWHSRKAGEVVETDSFWEHRFGGIRTMYAGTHEHSLMNWFAHFHIWDHFDEHLPTKEGEQSGQE